MKITCINNWIIGTNRIFDQFKNLFIFYYVYFHTNVDLHSHFFLASYYIHFFLAWDFYLIFWLFFIRHQVKIRNRYKFEVIDLIEHLFRISFILSIFISIDAFESRVCECYLKHTSNAPIDIDNWIIIRQIRLI